MRIVKSFNVPQHELTSLPRKFSVKVPRGSIFLHLDMSRACAWFECEQVRETELRVFRLYATDEAIELDHKFVKTVHGPTSLSTTYHLYERGRS